MSSPFQARNLNNFSSKLHDVKAYEDYITITFQVHQAWRNSIPWKPPNNSSKTRSKKEKLENQNTGKRLDKDQTEWGGRTPRVSHTPRPQCYSLLWFLSPPQFVYIYLHLGIAIGWGRVEGRGFHPTLYGFFLPHHTLLHMMKKISLPHSRLVNLYNYLTCITNFFKKTCFINKYTWNYN